MNIEFIIQFRCCICLQLWKTLRGFFISISCESEDEVKELLDRVRKWSKRRTFFEKTQRGNEVTWNIAQENE